ncbi:hypothetical protein HFN89_06795 [Rhizobium laguerreae]|nr:hypothetical protein [Rhizobium laguerreae]
MPISFKAFESYKSREGVLNVGEIAHIELEHALVSITLRFYGDRILIESFFINLKEPIGGRVSATVTVSIKIDDLHNRSDLSWQPDDQTPAELIQLASKTTQDIVDGNSDAIDGSIARAAERFADLVDREIGELEHKIRGYRSLKSASAELRCTREPAPALD